MSNVAEFLEGLADLGNSYGMAINKKLGPFIINAAPKGSYIAKELPDNSWEAEWVPLKPEDTCVTICNHAIGFSLKVPSRRFEFFHCHGVTAMSTTEYKGFTITIAQDETAESPREDYVISKMVCWHNRSNLGDEQPKISPQEWLDSMCSSEAQDILERINNAFDECRKFASTEIKPEKAKTAKKLQAMHAKVREEYLNSHYVMLPLWGYDHGSFSVLTSPHPCQFDSGRLGWIYVETEKALKEYGLLGEPFEKQQEQIKEILKGEVESYNAWINGESCYFSIDNADGNEDSCGGYYSEEDALAAAKDVIDGYDETTDNDDEIIEVCNDCISGIANDDYTGLDYHLPPNQAERRMNEIKASIASFPRSISSHSMIENRTSSQPSLANAAGRCPQDLATRYA